MGGDTRPLFGRPLFGRDDELRRLAAALEDAKAGRGRLIVVSGEPGIGKTHLADRVTQLAESQGLVVAWGRAWEAGGAPPFWPWTQVLRALASLTPARDEALAAVLPEIGMPAPASDAREARFRVFEAIAGALEGASRVDPLLVVLDDVHAADEPSLHVLHFVARNLRRARIVIVATLRDVATRPSPEVTDLLHRLGREGERVSLRRLSVAEVASWIARDRLDPDGPRFAEAVHAATEGNPLFVEEVLRLAAARGRTAVPDQVRAVIGAHLDLLEPSEREVVELASIQGREVDAGLLRALADRPIDVVDRALRRAVEVGVLEDRGDDRLAFGHVLLRDEVHRAIPASRRAALHWKHGERLAHGPARDLATAAHHLFEGLAAGEVTRAVEVATRAAEHADRVAAYEDAAALLGRASDLLPSGDRERLVLSIARARARFRAGANDEGRKLAADTFAEAEAAGDARAMAEAAIAYGTELLGGRIDREMIRLLREALARLDASSGADDALRARVLARLGSALVPSTPENHLEAHALANEAIAIAERHGDPATTYAVLQWAVPALGFTIPSRDRAPVIRRMLELAIAERDPVGELRARQLDLLQACEQGDGRRTVTALEQRLAALGRPYHAFRASLARAIVAIAEGRARDADAHARAMRAQGLGPGVAWVRPLFLLLRVSVLNALDDGEMFADEDEGLVDALDGSPALRSGMLAILSALRGRIDEGRAHLARAPFSLGGPPVLAPLAEATVRLGDRTHAERLLTGLAEIEEANPFTWGPSGAFAFGPLALQTGRLAAMLGRVDESIRWFETTIRRCELAGFPAHRAQAERDLAGALRARGGEGDERRARELLASARTRAEALGMRAFVDRLALEPARPSASPARAPSITLERDGDVFRLEVFGEVVRLEDRKGVHYLERLVREPGRELHVFDLIGLDEADGDAGPVLDATAKASYRARLDDLGDALEEANRFGDRARATRVQAEIDALASELARGVGLGGRDRKAASGSERARINVQRRIRDVLARIEAHAPVAERWLAASIRTGTYCSFVPVPAPEGTTR